MKPQPLKQRCFHAYLIGTGTASTATRISFNPSCSLGLILGSSTSDSSFSVFWGVLNLDIFSLNCLDGLWFVLSVTPRVFIP